MKSTDFRAFIVPIDDAEQRFDWRVTVQRLTDGMTRHERVSGGWQIAEACANGLAYQLGLPANQSL